MMRNIGNHVQAGLVRGITAQAGISALNREKTFLIVESMHSTDWASATFIGANHRLALRLQGKAAAVTAAARALAGLTTHEFDIGGTIVAEIAVSCEDPSDIHDGIIAISLTVNALTICD